MPENVPLAEPARQVSSPPERCVPAPGVAPAPGVVRHAWETGGRAWDIFYLVVFAAVLAVVLIGTPGSTLVAAVAIGALVPWYLFAGRPLWTGGRAGPLRATVYTVGLFAAFGAAQSQNPNAWFLAFAIAPQLYSFIDTRLAMGLGVALNFLAAGLLAYRFPSGAAEAFAIAAAGGGFSLFYGAWVSRIISQSAERAEMIDQLEATRTELAAAQHEAGRLSERQRLAADIHDTLAQGFASILMLIQAAQADLDGSHPVAGRHLEQAAHAARENLTEARALLADLAPAQLEDSTLPDALRRLSAEPGASFAASGSPRPLPMATEVVLLRVCQEALANVRKHARARATSVQLRYEPSEVLLEVSDDGLGFDPDQVNGGYGLRGMRTRVAEAGGTLTVRSAPGSGTSVRAMVPA